MSEFIDDSKTGIEYLTILHRKCNFYYLKTWAFTNIKINFFEVESTLKKIYQKMEQGKIQKKDWKLFDRF